MSAYKQVAIIGAGPAGLITGSILKKAGFSISLYEQRECLGGTWAIQPLSTLVDIRDGVSGIYSPIYSSLRCNVPKQIMELPDFPFPDDYPCYPRHNQVFSHLQRFAEHNDLLRHIRFNHRFLALEANSQPERWQVQTSQSLSEFDAVIFCNSRYHYPTYPDLEAFMPFTGRLEHSFSYREPEAYLNQRVALMGTGSSGEDLSREISHCASRVYLCAHSGSRELHKPVEGAYGAHNNLTRQSAIVACDGRTVILENGKKLRDIDVLILCTGYQPDPVFRQALPSIGLSGDKNNLAPLYLNLFHPRYPELAVTGMELASAPFILYHCQAKVIAGYLQGKILLPNAIQRQFAAEHLELQSSGRVSFSIRQRRSIAQLGHLAKLAGIKSPAKMVDSTLSINNKQRLRYPDDYRDLPWEGGEQSFQ
ncbi:hypothetical protein GZ77_22995 [Endozoicomonas montiporae]|uniref:Monooxygenase n=2 Tax=Endozoicomonas montiporae TaxID=1027273 RepID=A0A081N0J8_9GAMM|nr:NAD(P)-binding protein [Endozoicomonas montiporae]AMO54433.1 dimethylaniline monooxygenase [Endozoicomonas montiporae CL-33]KEQ11971.1 hypothetical protein GZ77_22995 [Endozoicomonas montiporae]